MIGISQIVRRLRRHPRSAGGLTAVEFRSEGTALAHVESRLGSPAVTQCMFLPGEGPASSAGELKKMVKSLGFAGGECVLVLSAADYRLIPVDAPDVPDHELREAVRWKIGDMVDYPIDQAAVEVIHLPEDMTRGRAKSVFVVASPRDQIRSMLDHLEDAGLPTRCVDISQLALRNLVERCVESSHATALLVVDERQSLLVIIRNGNIYLSRPVNFNSRMLQREGNELEIGITQLVGELKRSLDYFEVQLRQEPVVSLAIVPLDEGGDLLTEKLEGKLGIETFLLNVPDVIPCDAALPSMLQHHCAAAIGGALRSRGEL